MPMESWAILCRPFAYARASEPCDDDEPGRGGHGAERKAVQAFMNTQIHEGIGYLRAAVRITESICSLPAVATQDWCDRAAAAVLPLSEPSVSLVMIGQVDTSGVILRQEATGVAGCYLAEVTTTIGQHQTSTSVVPIDSRDANLARLRTMLAQARELSWIPGAIAPGSYRASTVQQLGLGPVFEQTNLGRRWDAIRTNGVLLGVAALSPAHSGRALIVEVGLTGSTAANEHHAAVLSSVLPTLAKRASLAVGDDPADDGHWLTQREQVILQELLLGKSVREIAEELGRSPHTVHDHVKSLHRKLNASSRGELVARALGYTELTIKATAEPKPSALGSPSKV